VAHLENMEEIQDFKITRLENEVSFFKATTQESMLENGKRLDRIISILEDDDSINKKGLVSQVKDMEARMYSLNNFLKAYKLAIAMIAGLFTAIGAAIGTYINFKKM